MPIYIMSSSVSQANLRSSIEIIYIYTANNDQMFAKHFNSRIGIRKLCSYKINSTPIADADLKQGMEVGHVLFTNQYLYLLNGSSCG